MGSILNLNNEHLIVGDCGHWWQLANGVPPGVIATCPTCMTLVSADEVVFHAHGEDCCDWDNVEYDCRSEIAEALLIAGAKWVNSLASRNMKEAAEKLQSLVNDYDPKGK